MKSFKEIANSITTWISGNTTSDTVTTSSTDNTYITAGTTYDSILNTHNPYHDAYYDIYTNPYFKRDCTIEEHKDIGCLPYACTYCQLDNYMQYIELQELINKGMNDMGRHLTTSLYGGTIITSSGNTLNTKTGEEK